MSALTNYQGGTAFPTISSAMLATIAEGLNPADTELLGGPPATPHIIEALIDAITALDQQLNPG